MRLDCSLLVMMGPHERMFYDAATVGEVAHGSAVLEDFANRLG
ncbi:MAG: hypothetical protein Q8M19_00655 [Reyranella sp.]|nr:hypothetical protein [Reyranella sp.]